MAQASQALRERLAELTHTNAADWFLVFKARYGMLAAFETIRRVRGEGEVVTQLYTCCTAVDPIVAAGLSPVYADVDEATLAASLDTVSLGPQTRAVVLQHTLGIMSEPFDTSLVERAHAAGAVVVEDDAHCVGRLGMVGGAPCADVAIHSFGVEKMLPQTYFGGAVWVSPQLTEDLRAPLVELLGSLPAVDGSLERAALGYRRRLQVLSHAPGSLSRRLRASWTSDGSFEPAVADVERRAGLPHAPLAPGEALCERVLAALDGLPALQERHASCTEVYAQAFAEALAQNPSLPLATPVTPGRTPQPLLRFPVFVSVPGAAEVAEQEVRALGGYAVRWYSEALYPGSLDDAAFGLDRSRGSWPTTFRLAEGALCLPCDVSDERARQIARRVLEVVRAAQGITPEGTASADLIGGEDDVPARLAPVVVGGDILGYTYARSFHELYGLKTTILSGVNVKMTSSSRFVSYHVLDGMTSERRVLEHLCAQGIRCTLAGRRGLLLGSVDWHARIISQHKELLERWFVVPYISFALLDDITQKSRFYQICEELGIAYPQTWELDFAQDNLTVDSAAYPYPLILKPSNSAAWDMLDFPGKKKVYEIAVPEELDRAVADIRAGGYRHRMVIQDFIPGDDAAIRSLTTFSDATGDLRVVSGGIVALQDHSPAKIGNPVTIVPERVERIIEDARAFLRHTGYRGYANFDIKYDERDGSYRFFEVNTRAGRNTYYVSLGGVNMAWPIVQDWVLGQQIPYTEAYTECAYTIVPPVVIERSVRDAALRERVLNLYKRGLARSPLDCPADTPLHQAWWQLYYRHQVSNFRRHLWSKEAGTGDAV